MSEQQAPARRPQQPPQQAQSQPRPRTDLSREELRAHLANVESQIKSALRIIASESKGMQQAHSALRADLSSALVRLQADMNGSSSELAAKLDRLGAEISFLSRQRRIGRLIFATFGMTLSFVLGVLVIAGWLLVKEGVLQSLVPPVPIEDMFERDKSKKASPPSSLNERPRSSRSAPQAPSGSTPQQAGPTPQGTATDPANALLLPGAVERQPLGGPSGIPQGATDATRPPSRESEQEGPPNLLLQDQVRQ